MVINIDKVMTQVMKKALTKLVNEAVTKGAEKPLQTLWQKL